MTCCRAYEVSAATALSKTRLPSVSALYTSSSSAPWVIFLIEWVSWWTPLDAKVAYAVAISMGFTLAVPSTFDGFGVRPIEQPPVSPDFISSSVQLPLRPARCATSRGLSGPTWTLSAAWAVWSEDWVAWRRLGGPSLVLPKSLSVHGVPWLFRVVGLEPGYEAGRRTPFSRRGASGKGWSVEPGCAWLCGEALKAWAR